MHRAASLFCLLLALPTGALCQSTATDSQTLQAILAEVRQLRDELRTTSAAAQRAQILVYRLQAQQAVVTRLSQKTDSDHSRLDQLQSEERRLTANVKRFEDSLNGQNESERKQTEQQINQFKHRIEQLSSDEQEVQARIIAAEEELRLEQAKLAQLHDALDRIDKALEQLSHASRATD